MSAFLTRKNGGAAALRARQAPFPEQAKSLSEVRGWTTVAAIALQWACIFAAAAAAELTPGVLHWPAVLLAIIIIASRQQAFAVLAHEAVHYRLFANRQLNDAVSDLFCSLPIGMVTSRYRATHLAHHLEPLGESDPDWTIMRANPRQWGWPKTPRERNLTLLRDAFGLGFLAYLQQWKAWSPMTNFFGRSSAPMPFTRAEQLRIGLFFVTVTALVIGSGAWRELLLFWVLPLVTVSQFLFRVRTIAEHMGCGPGQGMGVTRNVEAGWLERALISPMNVGHHLTHHLFPGVPWYNLPKLTRKLHDDPAFREAAFVSESYLGKTGVVRYELGAAALAPEPTASFTPSV